MERRQWHETLRYELTRQGLPTEYVARLMGELSDHAEDWQQAHGDQDAGGAGADLALGTPRELARAAAVQYRRTQFAGRHSALLFAIAPVPLFFAVEILLALGFGYLYQVCVGDMSAFPLGIVLLQALRLALVFIPVTTLSLGLFWIARRSAVSIRWRLVACVLLAIVAALHSSSVDAPGDHSAGRLAVGIGYPCTLLQVLQAMVPFLVLFWSSRGTLLARGQSTEPA